MGSEIFLHEALRQYYTSRKAPAVPEIGSREFGIGEFGRKISSRHLSFRTGEELNHFLAERAPFYISYSNALYQFPAARPMEAKSLQGADLIYEFDADEIKTNCKLGHDSWKCGSCKASGKGRLLLCPECGSGTSVEEWVCPECLGEAKKQTARLISSLRKDFGLSEGIFTNFSGSKGFHIHVRGEHVRALSKSGRLELLDFLTGTNLNLKSLGFFFEKRAFACPKRPAAKGWAKKILGSAVSALEGDDTARLGTMGNIPVGAAGKLLKEKHSIISHMDRGLLLCPAGVNAEKFWSSCLAYIVSEQKLDLDRQTSIDINKIIRVPNTIHGSTGLLAKEFPVEALNSFEPLKDSVVLPDRETKVAGATAPKFYLNGKWFGPFGGEDVSLPLYAAFYLAARGNGQVGG